MNDELSVNTNLKRPSRGGSGAAMSFWQYFTDETESQVEKRILQAFFKATDRWSCNHRQGQLPDQVVKKLLSVHVWQGAWTCIPATSSVHRGRSEHNKLWRVGEHSDWHASGWQSSSWEDERREVLYLQYTEFTILAMKEKAENSFRFKMLLKDRKTPFQYWQSDGAARPDLQRICIKPFILATLPAASERNVSTMGFVHTKLRNSLATKTVEKLVYIKSNHAICLQKSKLLTAEICW